jgi:DNA helicase-2/ATP-dependent DNA helicase PcrA
VRVLAFPHAYEEAEWAADTVEGLIEEGIAPGEIAFLYRTKYQSVSLEEALATRSVPYQVVDTIGFFERKEVKDLRAYMQLLLNPRDDEAFARIVNVPSRGIGKKTLNRLQETARRTGQPLFRAVHDPAGLDQLGTRAQSALRAFCELYGRLSSLRFDSIYSLVKQLIRETDYLNAAPPEEREEAQEILDYFVGYAKQYDKRHPGGDLAGFMEHTALISDVDGWNASAKAVSLMTLHSAKGLEFDVVIVTGLDEGILPHQRSLEENSFGDEAHALEEERRLLHVGMTRARKRLYLTHAQMRMVRGQEEPVSPSRFLQELPHEGVQRESVGGELPQESPALQFAREAPEIVERKKKSVPIRPQSKPLLQIVDGRTGQRLASGTRVVHASYGEGVVVSVDSAGKHHMVRVDFPGHGVLTLLLSSS